MTSQAQALEPLPGVRGLAFLVFPLHPAGKPTDARARHLEDVRIPMLFLQGTRDALADLALLRPVVERLGGRATLTLLDGADHSFRVPARSGRNNAEVLGEALDALAAWMERVVSLPNAALAFSVKGYAEREMLGTCRPGLCRTESGVRSMRRS